MIKYKCFDFGFKVSYLLSKQNILVKNFSDNSRKISFKQFCKNIDQVLISSYQNILTLNQQNEIQTGN